MANPDPVSAIAPRTALGQKTLATPVQRQGWGCTLVRQLALA
jgi:hypothetical protein